MAEDRAIEGWCTRCGTPVWNDRPHSLAGGFLWHDECPEQDGDPMGEEIAAALRSQTEPDV